MTLVWLNLPIIDSRVFLEHLPSFMAESMSSSHSCSLCSVRKTRKRRVSTTQPRMIFFSSNFPSAACLVMLMMSSLLQASFSFFLRKSASSTRGTACLILAVLSPRSRQPWKRSSMKLSVQMSRAGRLTASLSAFANGMCSGSALGGKSRLNAECREWGSHVGSKDKSCATSAAVSLTVLKIAGAGEEPKGSRVKR